MTSRKEEPSLERLDDKQTREAFYEIHGILDKTEDLFAYED